MTLPPAVIYVVAALDLIGTSLLSLQLDPIPVVHKPHPSSSGLLGNGFFKSLHQKVKAGPLATPALKTATGPTAHRLLLFVVLVCLARCATLFVAAFGVSKAHSQQRSRGQTSDNVVRQTQTGPLVVAAVCFSSLAANTFVLNLLFQARPARVSFIGTGLTISGLVSGQVVLSLLEWVLFVLVVGREGDAASTGISSESQAIADAPTQDEPAVSDGAYEIRDANLVTDTRPDDQKQKTVMTNTTSSQSIVQHATQASEDLKSKTQATGSAGQTGSYGTFVAASTSPSAAAMTNVDGEAGKSALASNGEAIKTEPQASETATQVAANPSSSSMISSPSAKQSSADPTLVGVDDNAKKASKGHERQETAESSQSQSQDIVDITDDRDASKQQARQRLDSARQKGNSRRRSIWEKVRRKSKVPQTGTDGE